MSNQPVSTCLAANLSLEVLDGVAHPIFHKGETLPIKTGKMFSTTSDNQKFIEIHFVHGNSPIASENTSLGKWKICGIPDAPRGIPQVRVFFNVEADGIFAVKADLYVEKKSLEVCYLGEGTPRVQIKKLPGTAELS
jgi:molecular chaperone DnaK (HSP70)